MVQTTFSTARNPWVSPQPPEYAIARRLRHLAGAIESAGTTPVGVHATVQYGHGQTAEVQRVAELVEAPPPERRQVAGGWHYDSEIRSEGDEHLRVLVFCGVDEPPEAKRERLRRELAELDAQIGDNTPKAAAELAEAAATGWRDEATGLISGPLPEASA